MAATLTKQTGEIRFYDMDFTNVLGLDETITGVVEVVSYVYLNPTDGNVDTLVVDSPSALGNRVQARISGGENGCIYKITCRVSTNRSPLVEGDGLLAIKDL